MEAFATIRESTTSVILPPLVHKRQLSSVNSSPAKRRKLSEPVSSPGSPMPASSMGSKAVTRPNMTASSSITLDMLRPHFEEPLAKVAASFGICVTLLKKICRRHGIARWPHRQITGLRKSIASMEHAIGYFDGDRRESYAGQLLKQKNKLTALLEDPTTNNPLLASEDENTGRQPKVLAVQKVYKVPQASVARASSPTGPLLVESPYQSVAAMPLQTPPLWLPASHEVESSYTQKHQRLCHLATNYYGAPTGSSPAIYLPPLRRESRSVLPPISSLVVSSANFNTPSW